MFCHAKGEAKPAASTSFRFCQRMPFGSKVIFSCFFPFLGSRVQKSSSLVKQVGTKIWVPNEHKPTKGGTAFGSEIEMQITCTNVKRN